MENLLLPISCSPLFIFCWRWRCTPTTAPVVLLSDLYVLAHKIHISIHFVRSSVPYFLLSYYFGSVTDKWHKFRSFFFLFYPRKNKLFQCDIIRFNWSGIPSQRRWQWWTDTTRNESAFDNTFVRTLTNCEIITHINVLETDEIERTIAWICHV